MLINQTQLLFVILRTFLFVSCIYSSSIIAEAFELEVLQKGSGDPVPEATVLIKQSGDYDTTNESGKVVFEDVSLPFDLKILSLGYETLELMIEKIKASIYLEPLEVEGEGLEVVEERIKEKTSKIVLQKEELRGVAGTQGDPIKMIESLPGVVTIPGGGGGGGPNAIYVRGSSGDENSFLINQIPVDYLYHIWGISVINSSLVDNFNIFLGGFPVEYRDVLGGVVDIKLRKPKTDRLHQTYRVALNESAVLVEGPINNKQSFYVAARASYIDKVLSPFIDDLNKLLNDDDDESDFAIITLPRYWDAQANWHYALPKGSVDLFYFGSNDEIVVDINQVSDLNPDVIGRFAVNYGFHTFGAQSRYRFSPKFTGLLTTSFKQGHVLWNVGSDDDGTPFGIDIKINEGLLHPQLYWSLVKNHEITIGNEVIYGELPVISNIGSFPSEENLNDRNFSGERKFRTDTTMKIASSSPYAKWRWTFDKLNTILGLRYSKVRGSGGMNMSAYSPRIAFEYQANKNVLLTTSWGKYVQLPKPAQLIKGYGNPNLSYTEAEHRIAGIQIKVNPLWSVQLEGYYKPMEKLVLTRPFESPPNNYLNDGEGQAWGIDLLVKREYGNRKMGWLSYSYSKSKRTLINGSDRDFSADQPHAITLVWNQPFTDSWSKWSWGFKLQAGSGQPYTPVVGRVAICKINGKESVCPDQNVAANGNDPNVLYWNPIYAERNILRRPFFHQLDIRIDRLIRYNTWTMKVYLDLLNVTVQDSGVEEGYGSNYRSYKNPRKSGFPAIIFPFLGVEATF